jgi:hypothetical protein
MTSSPERSDPIFKSQGLKAQPTASEQAPGNFQSYMQSGASAPERGPGAAAIPGPAEAPSAFAPPTVNSVGTQIAQVNAGIAQVQTQLGDPNLKLKRSQAHLLRNKLSDANDSISQAATRLGIDPPPLPTPAGSGPVERFLTYLNHGQTLLQEAKAKLQAAGAAGDQIRPADLLLVQIKMSQAQQEIEFSSALLGKIMDSIKTILNTPL